MLRILLFATSLLFLTVNFASALSYEAVWLGFDHEYSSNTYDINNNGQVVGWSTTASSPHDPQAFLYDNGVMQNLGTSYFNYRSVGTSINNSGQVVISTGMTNDGVNAGIYDNGAMIDLGVSFVNPTINDNGQIAGNIFDHYYSAYLYENGLIQNIGNLGFNRGGNTIANDINNSAQIVGSSKDESGIETAFIYENGIMTSLGSLGSFGDDESWPSVSRAYAINDNGQIVGTSVTYGYQHAFIYENGIMQDIGSLLSGQSSALDINNKGQIIGAYNRGAFIYDSGVMYDLRDLIVPNNFYDRSLERVSSINDKGQIVGYGRRDGNMRAVLLNPIPEPVPEPATILLLGSGLAGLAFYRRKRK